MATRSLPAAKDLERFWSKVDKSGLCWIWTGQVTDRGYGVFKLKNYPERAHRISYSLANGDIPAGLYVCHKCDNPSCVNPGHLFVGTHDDNMLDKSRKERWAGHFVKEEYSKLHRINAAQASLIKTDMVSGLTNAEIAKKHDVPADKVKAIRRHRSWKWVDPQIKGIKLPKASQVMMDYWDARRKA